MKRIILAVLVALGSLTANAQIYVGGETGLWRNTDNNNTNFTICPEVGYELNKNWDLGLAFGFNHDYNGDKKHKDFTKMNTFEVSPYARWTYAKLGPVNLFLEMGFGFETYKVKVGDDDVEVEGNAQNAWNLGVKPGLSINVAKHLQFITHLGFLGYRDSDDEFDGHKHDGFGFQLQSDNLTVGLLYKF